MEISMLMSTRTLCEWIENGQMEHTNDILERLKCFDMCHIIDEERIGDLYELLHRNRRVSSCREFSIFLDRDRAGSRKQINQNLFAERSEALGTLAETESKNVKAILYHKAVFDKGVHLLALGKSDVLRLIACKEDLCSVLTLFGQDIDGLHEFSQYIQNVYDNLVFDREIEKSMEKLEAGFLTRRHEILYHLYRIHEEMPVLIEKYGVLDNSSLGDKMSIPCSPERDRTTVENKLTKKADNGKNIKCELHTKMDKIGSRKPDRIYFCASVPDKIKVDNVDLSGKIYVYKITEHA